MPILAHAQNSSGVSIPVKNTTITSLSQQLKTKHALNCLMAPAFLLPVFQLTRAIHLVTGASPSLPTFRGFMKTPLVTRNEIAEAIALHTACMPTREIPGAIANYFMITRRFYTRTDKAVINRLLIAEIRDYLIEQGRLRYATVAAEMRKEAHRMTGNNLNVEKPAPVASATPAPALNVIPNTGDTIDSQTLLKMVNEARKLCSEKPVRNNDFIARVKDELEGETYEIFVGQKKTAQK